MIQLTISNDKRLLPGTASYISMVAKEYGVPDKRCDMLCFLVETVLEKRVDSLNEQNPHITVGMEETMREIRISITDKGVPYVLTENQKNMLRKGLADRFTLEQLGAQGQRISICFDHEYTEKEEHVKENVELLDRDISCFLTGTSDEEIIEAIRCIYSVYGYDYLHPQIFQVEHFRQNLTGGSYISMMCRNTHGQILGHVALEEQDVFPGLVEHCNLVVKPFARGLGAAGRLTDDVLKAGADKGKKGIFSRPNLVHQATQKILNKCGFVPCAIDFNGVWYTEQKKDFGDSDRGQWAYAVHMFDTESEHVLYLPDECRDFITDIFEQTGMKYRIEASDELRSEPSSVSWDVLPSGKTLDVMINSIGPDLEKRLEEIAEQESMYSVRTTLYYLNMNDPGCIGCYEEFRRRGFIFSGCLPGSTAGDFIIMEDLKGYEPDRAHIDPAPGYREMLDKLYDIMDRTTAETA